MLGSLAILLALPWVTTTGCDGDSAPVVHYGYALLTESLQSHAVFWIGPGGLVACALLGYVARAVFRSGRRALAQLAALACAVGGATYTFIALFAPTAGEHEEHHAAAFAGTGVLVLLIVDALVRLAAGVREHLRARRLRRRGAC